MSPDDLFSGKEAQEQGGSESDPGSASPTSVLQAFENRWEQKETIPFRRVVITGQGPFQRGKIWSYLSGLGAKVRVIGELSGPDVLVLGRERFEKESIKGLLRERKGKTLQICSQEMLLAWALSGVDPNQRSETAMTFVKGHPALSFVAAVLRYRWPGTDPLPSSAGAFNFEGPSKSPLKRLGYTAGKEGAPLQKRRHAMRLAFELELDELPGRYSQHYLQEWGPPESGTRLKKIADKLASECRTRRDQNKDFSVAISHWEDDLAWLKEEFYNPLTYGFKWPSTATQ